MDAIRLDAEGRRFQYRIDGPGVASALVREREEAIDMLTQLGVTDAAHLLTHVETWGSVELPTSERK